MYAKIFPQMFDGTLATRGPWQAMVTFQQLLILADRHGDVDLTAEVISRRTTIPLEIIQTGLKALSEPDPGSRSPAEDGRRIVLLSAHRDWGWHIVNFEAYHKISSEEERREYKRQWDADNRPHRARPTEPDNPTPNPTEPDASDTRKRKRRRKQKTKAGRAARASRLPQDWILPKTWGEWALTYQPTWTAED